MGYRNYSFLNHHDRNLLLWSPINGITIFHENHTLVSNNIQKSMWWFLHWHWYWRIQFLHNAKINAASKLWDIPYSTTHISITGKVSYIWVWSLLKYTRTWRRCMISWLKECGNIHIILMSWIWVLEKVCKNFSCLLYETCIEENGTSVVKLWLCQEPAHLH